MMTPFQSCEYGAKQDWFEPMMLQPDVKQDLVAQADMYEAFFSATIDEPWFAGLMTWGYYFEDEFNTKEYASEKSSTVRNKPAAQIVKKMVRAD
ncbi:MAG: hypothetical protein ABH829_01575 [archaeon]